MNIPQLDIPEGHIKIAEYDPLTEVHGPGKRFAIWVQGCNLSCQGCINPEMLSKDGGSYMRISQITSLIHRALTSNFPIEGITFMGGEPMIQAGAISDILEWSNENTTLNTVLFSGYKLDDLHKSGNDKIQKVLGLLDVLIDGPFIEAKRSMNDIRGSSNQIIHHLNDRRLENASFLRKTAEFIVDDNGGDLGVVQTGFTPDQIKI